LSLGENGDIRYESVAGEPAAKVRSILFGFNDLWSDYAEKELLADWTSPSVEIDVEDWSESGFTANFNDEDNNFVVEKFYDVISFNGEKWVSTNANGFAYNDFETEIGEEWNSVAGNWNVQNGHLVQTEDATSNLYCNVDQNSADKYMYEFSFKLSPNATNQRAGLHYMSSNGQTENHGDGYFIYFRLTSSLSRVEFYRVENDVYSQDLCVNLPLDANNWHNVKLIYDRTNGKSTIYYDNKCYGTYTDNNFFTNGSVVALRNGGAAVSFDSFRIYKSRGESETVSLGENGDINSVPSEDTQDFAQIISVSIDSANNICKRNYSVFADGSISNSNISAVQEVCLYPNPNNGEFVFVAGEQNVGKELMVFDETGKIHYQDIVKSSLCEVKLKSLPAGVYFAKIGNKNIKFVVE
ncbi:MAG: T9SS type A sorting domain-containing protein, partial [Bacteroidales bacterium]|nr:T9SS type A sorting domain-containing protein [Bacteroidales bacterium]